MTAGRWERRALAALVGVGLVVSVYRLGYVMANVDALLDSLWRHARGV